SAQLGRVAGHARWPALPEGTIETDVAAEAGIVVLILQPSGNWSATFLMAPSCWRSAHCSEQPACATSESEPSGIRTRDPLLKRRNWSLRKDRVLTAIFVGANDFADARPSEAFTRHHAFSFPYRYKNRYIVRAAGPIHPAARNEMTGTGTVTRPGLPLLHLSVHLAHGHGREVPLPAG